MRSQRNENTGREHFSCIANRDAIRYPFLKLTNPRRGKRAIMKATSVLLPFQTNETMPQYTELRNRICLTWNGGKDILATHSISPTQCKNKPVVGLSVLGTVTPAEVSKSTMIGIVKRNGPDMPSGSFLSSS